MLALIEGMVQAAVLSLAALGLSLVFGVMRVVNVAHGEFFMLGAVTAWVVTEMYGFSGWTGFGLAIIAAFLAAAIAAIIADRLILKRLDYQPEATIVYRGLNRAKTDGNCTTLGASPRHPTNCS